MTTTGGIDLQIQSLSSAYASGRLDPRQVIRDVHRRAGELADRKIWITLLDWPALEAQLDEVDARRAAGAHLPLYGVPFAIKDNIDLSDVPFFDSTALGVLVSGMKRLRATRRQLRLVAPRAEVRRLLELTLLDRVLAVDASRDEAIALVARERRPF